MIHLYWKYLKANEEATQLRDVDESELDEGIITPEELLKIKERLSKIERIIFGGSQD